MAAETTRQRYLDSVVAQMVSRGRTDLPLVAWLKRAGTSDRMLVYYFKTREALLTEVLHTVRSRRRKELAAGLAPLPRASDHVQAVADILGWMAAPADNAGVRFFLAAGGMGLGARSPSPASSKALSATRSMKQPSLHDAWAPILSGPKTSPRCSGASRHRSRATCLPRATSSESTEPFRPLRAHWSELGPS